MMNSTKNGCWMHVVVPRFQSLGPFRCRRFASSQRHGPALKLQILKIKRLKIDKKYF
jgi:hypothetical protein